MWNPQSLTVLRFQDNIDYSGGHVSPDNFLSILTGEKGTGGTGRTLTSTEKDDVFVYFADHGGVGSLAFPGRIPLLPNMRLLNAKKIINALTTAHSKKMFNRLVFYTEACESGSIFDGLLPSNISIYAVTAANKDESSWGWYCDDASGGNKVMGRSMGVCLGDMFSVKWLEDSDASNRATETLAQQFAKVKTRVTKSHVSHFGDLSIASEPLIDYQGEANETTPLPLEETSVPQDGGVSSRDAELKMLEWRVAEARSGNPDFNITEADAELQAEQASRDRADAIFGHLWGTFHQGETLSTVEYKAPRDFSCLDDVNEAVDTIVGGYTDYSLQYSKVACNLCESGVPADRIVAALGQVTVAVEKAGLKP